MCRPLLLHLHLLQVGDEQVEVALHPHDVLRKRTRSRGDNVGEPPRVRAVLQRPRPRLGRAVDLPRHQTRKLGVAANDLVGSLRTPRCGFCQPTKILTDIPLSLVRPLGTDSTKIRPIVSDVPREEPQKIKRVAVHTYPNELPSR